MDSPTLPFGEVLEAIDKLPLEQQEDLLAVVRRRLAERGRQQVIENVRQSLREFAAGDTKSGTAADLMKDLES